MTPDEFYTAAAVTGFCYLSTLLMLFLLVRAILPRVRVAPPPRSAESSQNADVVPMPEGRRSA